MSLKKHERSVSFDFEWKSSSISLLRCSKSCRLRWTNYLRPGVKRGNFIEHEEKMIIHLQELLGNRLKKTPCLECWKVEKDIKFMICSAASSPASKQKIHVVVLLYLSFISVVTCERQTSTS